MTVRIVQVASRPAVVAQRARQERRGILRAPLEQTSAARRSQLLKLLRSMPANDIASQHARILAALRTGTLTTNECRQLLDVVAPAARISELRAQGERIAGRWVRQETAEGRMHRFITYYLVRGKAKGAGK